MNDDYTFFTRRRIFLGGTGTLVALGSLPAFLSAEPEALHDGLAGLKQQAAIVLYREGDNHSVAFAQALAQAGLQALALTDDPVRLWRDCLAAYSGRPLLGLTHWPDYLVLSGLAAEQRRRVLLEMQHNTVQPGNDRWPAQLASAFLQLPVTTDRQAISELVAGYLQDNPVDVRKPSLFSWLIA